MIIDTFSKEYAILHRERESGDNIWTLCELSHVANEAGEATALANACLPSINVATVYLRSDAWLGWKTFKQVKDLKDEFGATIIEEAPHQWIRDRLSYSHFAEVGKLARRNDSDDNFTFTPDDAAFYLVEAAKHKMSVRRFRVELSEISGADDIFKDVKNLRRAALRVMRYGDRLPRRLNKMCANVASTQWDIRE